MNIFFLFCESVLLVLTVSKVQIMCHPWLHEKLGLKVGTASKNDRHIGNGPNFN